MLTPLELVRRWKSSDLIPYEERDVQTLTRPCARASVGGSWPMLVRNLLET